MHHKTLKLFDLNQIDAKALAMSLTYILEIYLKFKGKKGAHFKFWKIKKWLNEEMSESRLMDYKKRQDGGVMNLGDEDW